MYIGDSYKGYGADNSNLVISELRSNNTGYICNQINYDYNGGYDDDRYEDDPDFIVENY